MKSMVNRILNAMTGHEPESLPMTETYIAWENVKAAALPMMACFRVFTGIKQLGLVFEDKVQNSVFFYANMDENGNDTLLYARYVLEEQKISELEVNMIRARGDAGFQYSPSEVKDIPEAWLKPIPEGQRCSRQELLEVADYIYTGKADKFPYPIADDCFLMENGGMVKENPDYAETMWGSDAAKLPKTKDGLVCIPGDVMPLVSKQPGRALVIDEEQGVICLWGTIDGYVVPYVESHETSSCFVPTEAVQMHMDKTLQGDKMNGKCLIKPQKATVLQTELFRFYGGELHGQHRINQIQAIGARFPWED